MSIFKSLLKKSGPSLTEIEWMRFSIEMRA